MSLNLMHEALRCTLRPDDVSCSVIVASYCAGHRWQCATAVFRELCGSMVRPGDISLGSLLSGLATSAQWQGAVKVLAEAQLALPNLGPSAFALTMSAAVKSARWEVANLVFDELRRRGTSDSVCCAIALSSCASSLHWMAAARLLSDGFKAQAVPAAGSISESIRRCEEVLLFRHDHVYLSLLSDARRWCCFWSLTDAANFRVSFRDLSANLWLDAASLAALFRMRGINCFVFQRAFDRRLQAPLLRELQQTGPWQFGALAHQIPFRETVASGPAVSLEGGCGLAQGATADALEVMRMTTRLEIGRAHV